MSLAAILREILAVAIAFAFIWGIEAEHRKVRFASLDALRMYGFGPLMLAFILVALLQTVFYL